VAVWGSGYVATKIGLQYAAPFTFLSLRFCFGVLCLLLVVAGIFVWLAGTFNGSNLPPPDKRCERGE